MKIKVEFTLDEEQIEACKYLISCGGDFDIDPTELKQDIVNEVIRRSVQTRIHELHSRKIWNLNKYAEHPNIRQSHICRQYPVTMEDGRKIKVPLSTGKTQPIYVDTPARGTWKCDQSPDEVCWYDTRHDPIWDFCLFCGNPHERK